MAFPADWSSKQEIKIDNTKVSGTADLTDFPVYLDGNAFSSAVFSGAKTDGSDLRFTTDSAGTTQIPFEIVSWDSVGETCEIHAKLPTVSYNTDTSFYVWYGNSGASALAATDTYGSQAVWSDYSGVYHLEDTSDATSNAHTLTNTGSATFPSGKIGDGVDLNGSSQYLSRNDNYDLGNFDAQTVSMLLKVEAQPATDNRFFLIDKRTNKSGGAAYVQIFYRDFSGVKYLQATVYGIGGFDYQVTLSNDTWYLITYTADGSNGIKLYINDTLVDSDSGVGTTTPSSDLFILGNQSGSSTRYFNGMFDEVRIKQSEKSSDWIATEYANQNSPSTFATAVASGTDATAVVTSVTATGTIPSVTPTTTSNATPTLTAITATATINALTPYTEASATVSISAVTATSEVPLVLPQVGGGANPPISAVTATSVVPAVTPVMGVSGNIEVSVSPITGDANIIDLTPIAIRNATTVISSITGDANVLSVTPRIPGQWVKRTEVGSGTWTKRTTVGSGTWTKRELT